MKVWQRIKKAFQGFLKRMAQSNEESFGSEALDCCKLNRKQETGQRR